MAAPIAIPIAMPAPTFPIAAPNATPSATPTAIPAPIVFKPIVSFGSVAAIAAETSQGLISAMSGHSPLGDPIRDRGEQ